MNSQPTLRTTIAIPGRAEIIVTTVPAGELTNGGCQLYETVVTGCERGEFRSITHCTADYWRYWHHGHQTVVGAVIAGEMQSG